MGRIDRSPKRKSDIAAEVKRLQEEELDSLLPASVIWPEPAPAGDRPPHVLQASSTSSSPATIDMTDAVFSVDTRVSPRVTRTNRIARSTIPAGLAFDSAVAHFQYTENEAPVDPLGRSVLFMVERGFTGHYADQSGRGGYWHILLSACEHLPEPSYTYLVPCRLGDSYWLATHDYRFGLPCVIIQPKRELPPQFLAEGLLPLRWHEARSEA